MIEVIISKLDKVKRMGNKRFMACCPAHDDKTPSLGIEELSDGRILMNCFAGCDVTEVLHSIGLTMNDLFPEGALGNFKGWQQLQNQVAEVMETKKQKTLSTHKTVLFIADERRKKGIKLTPQDLEREREAYLAVRNEANNG